MNDLDFLQKIRPTPFRSYPSCGCKSCEEFGPSPGFIKDAWARMVQRIRTSDSPDKMISDILLELYAYAAFFQDAMNYIAYEVKIDDIQSAESEKETDEDVRGDSEKGHDEGNSGYKTGSDQGNRESY